MQSRSIQSLNICGAKPTWGPIPRNSPLFSEEELHVGEAFDS